MRQTAELKDIHAESLAEFGDIWSVVEPERKQCLEDRQFYSLSGAQWNGALGEQFENKPVNSYDLNLVQLFAGAYHARRRGRLLPSTARLCVCRAFIRQTCFARWKPFSHHPKCANRPGKPNPPKRCWCYRRRVDLARGNLFLTMPKPEACRLLFSALALIRR